MNGQLVVFRIIIFILHKEQACDIEGDTHLARSRKASKNIKNLLQNYQCMKLIRLMKS